MSRVLILVEGATEQAIVKQVFAPVLGAKGVGLFPRIAGDPGRKGGNRFPVVLRELKALMRQEPNSVVTTFFDYYGLPGDWPGLESAQGKRPEAVPAILEPAIAAAVAQKVGPDFNPNRFIPYIQGSSWVNVGEKHL